MPQAGDKGGGRKVSDSQKKTVAIQIGATSLADEGIPEVLDILQETARVNTLFFASYTFDRGTGGRQIEGHPFPDHGIQEYDLDFRGGNFAKANPKFYQGTFLHDFRAPDFGDRDFLEEIIPQAKYRNMKTFCWINENPYAPIPKHVPNFSKVLEVDCYGIPTTTPCFNNPDYHNFHLSLVEDYCKSYDMDGIAWSSERQGPLGNMIGGGWSHKGIGCFCEHCRALAKERGINWSRAIAGYRALDDFFTKARKDRRPNDGYFITFWRLLLQYPEILAWEKLWTDGLLDMQKAIYGAVKAIDHSMRVGWHVMHLLSFSPLYRAEQDYDDLRRFSDFIKIATYKNCAGPRFAFFVRNLCETILKDVAPSALLDPMYRILGVDEANLASLPKVGFSAEYLRRETARAVRGAGGNVEIWSGIDIDIPTEADEKRTEPGDVKESIVAAFAGGASGVVLSRKYSEMGLANLAAVGEALDKLIVV